MCDLPCLGIGITQENASFLVLDGVQGVVLVDLLGEEVGLGEDHCCYCGVVGQVCDTAETLSLDKGSIGLEQTLVVAQVVGVDFEVVSNVR